MQLDVEHVEEKHGRFAVIGKETHIFIDGAPLLDELLHDADECVGYEDVGGASRQLSTIAELIDLPLKQPQVENKQPQRE